MSRITWDALGERLYEVGLDHGVLYLPYLGDYINGIPWNGLTAVTAEQGGRSASGLYQGSVKTGNVYSPEEFSGSIKAYTYPEEFEQFFGEEEFIPGVIIPHQERERFGFSYRTLKGNDVDGTNLGYKIHIVYNVEITDAGRSYASASESLDLEPMEWKYECFPVEIDGQKPTAEFVFDSTRYNTNFMRQLEALLYGTETTMPRLPTVDEIRSYFYEGLFPTDDIYPGTLSYRKGMWLGGRTITKNGTYIPQDDDFDAYSSVKAQIRPDFLIVEDLPPIGEDEVFYYIFDDDSEEEDQYIEYMFVDGEWQVTGSKQIPISSYAQFYNYELTQADIEEILNS